MVWIKIACKHVLPTPEAMVEKEAGPGSIWQCPNCPQQFILQQWNTISGSPWAPYDPDVVDWTDGPDEQVRREADLNQQ